MPSTVQSISYTAFNKATRLKETVVADSMRLDIMYGPDEQRWKSVLKKNGTDVKTIIFAGDYEKVTENGVTRELYYIGAPDGLAAVYVKDASKGGKMYYAHTDHQGSIVSLTDSIGGKVFQASYDAWGKQTVSLNTIGFYRGYTGHEHLPEFGLINMNGRMYDPVLGRFLSPDNYVSSSDFSQAFNRYTYCLNNPMSYIDPDGNNPILIAAIIIGGLAGGYTGYKVADAKGYNMGNWQTYGYILGGAAIGGFSGYSGATIAAGGGFMANTSAIMAGSYMNSVGMTMLSGGDIAPSISFGVASYNFGTSEWGYLGKQGNSSLDNIGYGLGALANLSDVMAGFKPGDVKLRTENDPNYNSKGTGKDLVGHSQLSDGNGKVLIDWGPTEQVSGLGDWVGGTNSYENGNLISVAKMKSDPLTISGVNTGRIANYASYLNKGGRYNLALNNCVSQTSRALNISGVFNIGIHPYILQAQMYLRSIGVRPMLYSYYLYNR